MEPHRTQVRRILDYLLELAGRDFDERRKAIFADHSAKGLLKSGATIRRVVRAMEEVAAKFVSDAVEKVSVIAQDTEAFAHLQAALEDLWRSMEAILDITVNVASGRHPHDQRDDSVFRAAKDLFEKSKSLVRSKMELYRFSFTRPSSARIGPVGGGQMPAVKDTRAAQLTKGGRPLAEHWDDMWAAIAVALYAGDLIPKSQSDLERAMLSWLEGIGLEPATSTVRQRARRLWDRLQVEK
jgi:hypothetical protein